VGGGRGGEGEGMSVKRVKPKAGRPVKVPGEKGTKEKIFDAAVDLFAEKGYDRVSIRDIGRAVGITEAAVYRHYSSKDEILDSIFRYIEGRIYPTAPEGSIDALVDSFPLKEILEMTPRFMLADRSLARITRIMLIEMYHNEKVRNYVRRELFERPVDETAVLFKKLMEKGKIKPCDPRALSTMFISYMVYWYFEVFMFSYGVQPDLDRVEKEMQAQINLIVDLAAPEGGVNHE
jgi:AcrR family transcriptional regulator